MKPNDGNHSNNHRTPPSVDDGIAYDRCENVDDSSCSVEIGGSKFDDENDDLTTVRCRLVAIILSVLAILSLPFNTCCCSIPSLSLAIFPSCTKLSKSRVVLPIYIISIACAILSIPLAILAFHYTLTPLQNLGIIEDNIDK